MDPQPLLAAAASKSGFWLSLSLTYGAHAAVWAGAAALGSRARALSFAARHRGWKAALFGPLVSAALASAWFGGGAPPSIPTPALAWTAASGAHGEHDWRTAVELPLNAGSARRVGLWLALVASAAGLARFGGAAALLVGGLRGRRSAVDPRLQARFEALCARMQLGEVRLTEHDTLTSPLVLGAREVCVPRQLPADLGDAELDAVLAHELAHVERGDGVWFPLVSAVQHALWFQPFNHLVSANFRRSAELSCDDRAVEITQNPLGLARALVHIAERAAPSGLTLAPSMARSESELLPRVRRLALASPAAAGRAARGKWVVASSAAVLGAALVLFDVRVVPARSLTALERSAVPAATKAEAAPARATPTPPPLDDEAEQLSPAAQSARLAELARRERSVAAELAESAKDPAVRRDGTPAAVRVLELEQELNHLRATEAWLEQRFAAAWTKNQR